MRRLFDRLRKQKINPLDNGMVIEHQNLDESSAQAPGSLNGAPAEPEPNEQEVCGGTPV
jgi:hypothetical protein